MTSFPSDFHIRRFAGKRLTELLTTTTLPAGARIEIGGKVYRVLEDQGPNAPRATRFQLSEAGLYDPDQIVAVMLVLKSGDVRLWGIHEKYWLERDAAALARLDFSEAELEDLSSIAPAFISDQALKNESITKGEAALRGVPVSPRKAPRAKKEKPPAVVAPPPAVVSPRKRRLASVEPEAPPAGARSPRAAKAPRIVTPPPAVATPAAPVARSKPGRKPGRKPASAEGSPLPVLHVTNGATPEPTVPLAKLYVSLKALPVEQKAKAFDKLMGMFAAYADQRHENEVARKVMSNPAVVVIDNIEEALKNRVFEGTGRDVRLVLPGYRVQTVGMKFPLEGGSLEVDFRDFLKP